MATSAGSSDPACHRARSFLPGLQNPGPRDQPSSAVRPVRPGAPSRPDPARGSIPRPYDGEDARTARARNTGPAPGRPATQTPTRSAAASPEPAAGACGAARGGPGLCAPPSRPARGPRSRQRQRRPAARGLSFPGAPRGRPHLADGRGPRAVQQRRALAGRSPGPRRPPQQRRRLVVVQVAAGP